MICADADAHPAASCAGRSLELLVRLLIDKYCLLSAVYVG